MPEPQTCGRPTKSGAPCRNPLGLSEVACQVHATQHDRELFQAHRRGWNEGWNGGYESGGASARQQVEWLEKRVKELGQRLDDATRRYEIDGDQVVTVGKYAYRWRGETPLKVGDRVLLPGNWLFRETSEGTVTELGSTYLGDLSAIVRRLSEEVSA